MAQAILLDDVESLGERGAVVDVSKGYLRNYLIPRKLAQPATAGALASARQLAEAAERAAREAIQKASENAAVLSRTVLTISRQAGDDGRLFGSVTNQDIVDAVREARGLKLDKRRVQLEDPIKNVGTYMVVVEVSDGVLATIKTIVSAAKGA
jgi:large subunit ribosomal protein L9